MNIKETLLFISGILKKNKIIAYPELEAEMILANTLDKNKVFLLTHGDITLSEDCIKKVVSEANKRVANYPMAYITGRKEFYGLDFFVNENVLIPRPETELTVKMALNEAADHDKVCFADIGTGSGCIIVSLAKFHKKNNALFIASDISDLALETAKKNAKYHEVLEKIKFFNSDLASTALDSIKNTAVVLTANLPYLTPKQISKSPTIQAEPILALAAGEDGLSLYRRLFLQIKELSTKTKITAICEFDDTQTNSITILARSILPDHKFTIHKDFGGFDRTIKIYK
jgi:release factor glutamine methyltransferase